MIHIDKSGLLLCELQAKTFELSLNHVPSSSEIFIRRYMNSQAAKLLDSGTALQTALAPNNLLDLIEEQYGTTTYGTVKYSPNELYWIGYLYRYFSYTYELSSVQVYRFVKPKELRSLFLAYHTMDCAVAIARILEAKDNSINSDINSQYRLFRKIRESSHAKPRS